VFSQEVGAQMIEFQILSAFLEQQTSAMEDVMNIVDRLTVL